MCELEPESARKWCRLGDRRACRVFGANRPSIRYPSQGKIRGALRRRLRKHVAEETNARGAPGGSAARLCCEGSLSRGFVHDVRAGGRTVRIPTVVYVFPQGNAWRGCPGPPCSAPQPFGAAVTRPLRSRRRLPLASEQLEILPAEWTGLG